MGSLHDVAYPKLRPLRRKAMHLFFAGAVRPKSGVEEILYERMQGSVARIIHQVALAHLVQGLIEAAGLFVFFRQLDQGIVIQIQRLAKNRQEGNQPCGGRRQVMQNRLQ